MLKGVENGEVVSISGKNARLTPSEARQVLDVSARRFNEMLENNEIKIRKTKKISYLLMKDVLRAKQKIYESRGKLLAKITAQDWQTRSIKNLLN